MGVDDSSLVVPKGLLAQFSEVARSDHQIDLPLLEGLKNRGVKLVRIGMGMPGEMNRVDSGIPGSPEGQGITVVADDQHHPAVNGPGLARLDDSLKVGAPMRCEDTEVHRAAPWVPWAGSFATRPT